MLDPTVSLHFRFTVVVKICGNFDSGVCYLNVSLRMHGSCLLIEDGITRLSVESRFEARTSLLFKSKHWFCAQNVGERLCAHTAAKLHELWGLICWINGRLTEWEALNRRFEVVRAAKGLL